MAVYAPAIPEMVGTIRVAIEDMGTFRAKSLHLGSPFKKQAAALVTNDKFLLFHALYQSLPFRTPKQVLTAIAFSIGSSPYSTFMGNTKNLFI